jgi:hypothetical protein
MSDDRDVSGTSTGRLLLDFTFTRRYRNLDARGHRMGFFCLSPHPLTPTPARPRENLAGERRCAELWARLVGLPDRLRVTGLMLVDSQDQTESAAILKIKESMQEEAKRFEKDSDHPDSYFIQ